MLNYAYGVSEGQVQIAALAAGVDPTIVSAIETVSLLERIDRALIN